MNQEANAAMEAAIRYAAFVVAIENVRSEWEKNLVSGVDVTREDIYSTVESLAAAYGEDAWVGAEGICVARGARVDVFELSTGLNEILTGDDDDGDGDFKKRIEFDHGDEVDQDEMLEILDDSDYIERWEGA